MAWGNTSFSPLLRIFIFISAIIMALLISCIRYITGPDITLTLLYILPILSVSIFVGKWYAVFFSAFSALSWLTADLLIIDQFTYEFAPFVNSGARLMIFLFIIYLISCLKNQEELALRDHLTGLLNRRAFFSMAGTEIKRMRRFLKSLSIAYIDLDNFKDVNDSCGHSEGDALLKHIAGKLSSSGREIDIMARIGGDEFAILFLETDETTAQTVIKKLKRNLFQTSSRHGWPITCSIGLVTFNRPPLDIDELISTADSQMYLAKNEGKNRIKHITID